MPRSLCAKGVVSFVFLLSLSACGSADCPGWDTGGGPDVPEEPVVDALFDDTRTADVAPSDIAAVMPGDGKDTQAETDDDASVPDDADVDGEPRPLITVLPQYDGTQRVDELHVLLFYQHERGSGHTPPRDTEGLDIGCESLVNMLNTGLRPPPPNAFLSSTAMTLGESYSVDGEPLRQWFPEERVIEFTVLSFGLGSEGEVVVGGCDEYGGEVDLMTPGASTDLVLELDDVLPPPPVALCPPGAAPGDDGACYEVAGTLGYDDCDFLSACSGEGTEVFEDTDCAGQPSPGPELVFHIPGMRFETIDIAVSSETEKSSSAMPRVSILQGTPHLENCVSSWTLEGDGEGVSRTGSAIVHWSPNESASFFVVVSFPDSPASVSLCRRHPNDVKVCFWDWGLDCPLSRPEHCAPGTLWNPIERGCWPCGDDGCDAYEPDTRTCGGSALACEGATRCTQGGCVDRPLPSYVSCTDNASWLHTADKMIYDPWGRRVEQFSTGYGEEFSVRNRWEYDEYGAPVSACGGGIDFYSQEVYEWQCARRSYERDDQGEVTRMAYILDSESEPSERWTYDWGDGSRPSTVTRDGLVYWGDAPDGIEDAVWTLHWNEEGLLSELETDGGMHCGGGGYDGHPGDLHLSYMSPGRSFGWGPYNGFLLPPFAPFLPDFGPPDGARDMLWTFTYEDGRLLQTDIEIEPPYEFEYEDTRHLQWNTDETGRLLGVRTAAMYSCGFSYGNGPASDVLKRACPCP